jgi:hypothetical protein
MLTTPNFLLQSQHFITDSKFVPVWKPSASEINFEACLATTHSKKQMVNRLLTTEHEGEIIHSHPFV